MKTLDNCGKLSPFGFACFTGNVNVVQAVRRCIHRSYPHADHLQTMEGRNGAKPNLQGTETGFRFGYATLVVLGAQNVVGPSNHPKTLEYLLSNGVPPSLPDIVDFTALHLLTQCYAERADLAEILLKHGANVNKQNRYGEVPLLAAMQHLQPKTIDFLMEYGADLDIPEADGLTCRTAYRRTEPRITSVINKWISKRKGENLPRLDKQCGHCSRSDTPLSLCTRCRVTRYCSSECQSQPPSSFVIRLG